MCTPALGVIMGAALASDSLRARRGMCQRQGSDIAGQRWWGAPSDCVAKGPSRVDDDARVHAELLARERVAALRAIHGAARVLARSRRGGHKSARAAGAGAPCASRAARALVSPSTRTWFATAAPAMAAVVASATLMRASSIWPS